MALRDCNLFARLPIEKDVLIASSRIKQISQMPALPPKIGGVVERREHGRANLAHRLFLPLLSKLREKCWWNESSLL